MYSLFWRIFLWFWLAMIAVGAAIAWTTAQLGGAEIPPMIERAREQFTEDAAQALAVLETQGVRGLRSWLKDPAHTRAMRVFVLDPSGADLLGQTVPPRLRRFSAGPEGREFGERRGRARHGLVVRPVVIPGEGYLQLVAVFKPPHPVWHLISAPRLIVALIVSGLVCLGLARYLSAPVRRLRVAARNLAAGDWQARVGNAFGRRRDEIAGLGRDFDRMAERLQALLEAQQQLLRDVSHELRSPLARLQAALGLARQRGEGRVAQELDRIEKEAERLNELIGRIVSLTRMAATNGIAHEPLDLAALLDAVAQDAEFEAAPIRCHVRLTELTPTVISGEAELLHSAVENVVRNALRYTREGTTVELSLTHEAGDRAGGADAVIRVRDYGPGIDEAVLPNIFEPFVRAHEARDRGTGGYGLGLAITARAVRLHGGSVSAANEPGGGLTVTIRLPLVRREG